MGLIGKFSKLRMKQPCEGTLSVVGISMPDPSATSQNYRIDGVVSGPGFTPTAVVHHGVASVNKWPSSGDTLPITFDLAKPDRLVVHWDQLPTGRDQAEAATQALAERMRASSGSSTTREATSVPSTPAELGTLPIDLSALQAGTPDPAAIGALNALLASGAGNVVRLDADNPDTAALRAALLRAVGDAGTQPTASPVEPEPS